MAKSNRLPEKWFRRALWLVAFIFAGFLIGLGSRMVDDLPRVERALQTDQFVDQARYAPLRLQDDALDKERLAQSKAHESAELALEQKDLELSESLNRPCATCVRPSARKALRFPSAISSHYFPKADPWPSKPPSTKRICKSATWTATTTSRMR